MYTIKIFIPIFYCDYHIIIVVKNSKHFVLLKTTIIVFTAMVMCNYIVELNSINLFPILKYIVDQYRA